MNNNHSFILWFFLMGIVMLGHAQDTSLFEKLKKESKDSAMFTIATFQATRIQLGHSIETRKKNVLEISAMTRYWNTASETSNAFVADRMSARFGLEYGLSDRLTFGGGFSTINAISDVFLKYRLLRQQDKGKNTLSITLLQAVSHNGEASSFYNAFDTGSFGENLSFVTQVLIAKKFTRNFSLQISPTFIKRNTVPWPTVDDEHQFAVGFGARYKVGRHVAVAAEYYYVANPLESITTYSPFSLGVNWELSDLMLQFKMTNTPNFVEEAVIGRTRRNFNFKDGNFFFGFHATYFIQF
jgi:hypothetical protein